MQPKQRGGLVIAVVTLVAAVVLVACERSSPSVPQRDASTAKAEQRAMPPLTAAPLTAAAAQPGVAAPGCATPPCQCNDGIDNDGDGLTDWKQDLGCTSREDASEGGVPSGSLENGWTVFEPSKDSRLVFVSAAGNDAWDGRSAVHLDGRGPKRTLGAALPLLRDRMPDWLLLRRGDTWDEPIQLKVSGRSATEPVVVASYGDAPERPFLRSVIFGERLKGVAVVGLSVRVDGHDGALISFSNTADITIEDCRVQGKGLAAGGDDQTVNANWRVRRNMMLFGGGFYFTQVRGLLIEGNVLYRPTTPDDQHGMYITRRGNEGVVTRHNLVLMDRPRGNGIMQRPGGLSEGNVVVAADWQGIEFGACNDGDGGPCHPPVPVVIRDNVLLDGTGLGGGVSVEGRFAQPGAKVLNNIVAHMAPSSQPGAATWGTDVLFEGNRLYDTQLALRPGKNIRWRDNWVYSTQDRPLVSADDLPVVAAFSAEGNHFFSTRSAGWFQVPNLVDFAGWQRATRESGSGQRFEFQDPARNLASYNQKLGGKAEREAFFVEAVKQSKFAERPEYAAPAVLEYFREGFRVKAH